MFRRISPILLMACLCVFHAIAGRADEVIYRYEGNVMPYDPSAEWENANPCEPPCSASNEDGHLLLRWAYGGGSAGYLKVIAQEPETTPPPSLWVEWRFRSNHPLSPIYLGCDASFTVDYREIVDYIEISGDAVVSPAGDFVRGLEITDFHTYRFESGDGVDYRFSVDGIVFHEGTGLSGNERHKLAFSGRGGCNGDWFPNMVNEWDFVRYGEIACGERIIAADPAGGLLDASQRAGLDRFAVTFDAANYVYLDEITVQTSGGTAPQVIATRRRENDEPDTVEIVLDRPIPMPGTTSFTFNDGTIVNTVEYIFAPGDTNGDGAIDLLEVAAMQSCFGRPPTDGACTALDLVPSGFIDQGDLVALMSLLTGPSS